MAILTDPGLAVAAGLDQALQGLHPAHLSRLQSARITPEPVMLSGMPAWILARVEGKVLLYWPDDDSWGAGEPERGVSGLTLAQALTRLFGAPALRTCRGASC